MADTMDIVVPDLGDFADVEIIEVLVAAGDAVRKEDGLITLETDKATMDVPAPEDGTIVDIKVEVGGTVSAGDVIGSMTVAAGSAPGDTVGSPAAASSPPEPDAAATPEPVMTGGGKQTIVVPDLGDFADVDVIEVHVAAGDRVEKDAELITLETDKATMDVPSTHTGTIEKMLVAVGDKVSEGSPIADIDAEATAAETCENPKSGGSRAGCCVTVAPTATGSARIPARTAAN